MLGKMNLFSQKKHLQPVEFFLKDSVFNFNGPVKKHIWDTEIGSNCVLSYASIIMSKFEISFIENQ